MSQFDGQSAVNNIRQISHISSDNVYYTFKSQEHHNIRLTSIDFFLHGDLPLIQKYAYFGTSGMAGLFIFPFHVSGL